MDDGPAESCECLIGAVPSPWLGDEPVFDSVALA
jgi:hypothetical protein